jgi:hypothetical protein
MLTLVPNCWLFWENIDLINEMINTISDHINWLTFFYNKLLNMFLVQTKILCDKCLMDIGYKKSTLLILPIRQILI